MLPEKGGASTFTLFIADRLEQFGRPVTMNEWLDDILAEMPAAYATYCGQQYQAHAIQRRGSTPPLGRTTPPPEGWHVEGFDILNPKDRRQAVQHVLKQRIRSSRRSGTPWVIQHQDGTFSRDPEHHPRIVANGQAHYWTPETRASSRAESDAQVKIGNETGMRHLFTLLTLEERGVWLRHLADKFPKTRSAASRVVHRGQLDDLDLMVGDDPEKAAELLQSLLADWLDNR
jgi:hypothetical protein